MCNDKSPAGVSVNASEWLSNNDFSLFKRGSKSLVCAEPRYNISVNHGWELNIDQC